MNFVLFIVVGKLLGFGPAIAATLSTVLLFNYYMLEPRDHWSSSPHALFQTVFIFVLGSLIAALIRQYNQKEIALELANVALQDKTNAFVQAQQGSKSAAWTFDTRTRRTSWHEGGSEVFGRTLGEITAMGSPTALVLEDDRPLIAAAAERTATTGEPFQVEFRVLWPNGQVHWLEACGTPKRNDPSIWLGVTTDITERKNAELALVRSEKLAATSRLASSVAHEVNNPLASLANLIYLAKLNIGAKETQAYLEMADLEVRRIAQVTSQTLQFHKQQSAPTGTDIVEMLHSILQFSQSKISRSGITVKIEGADAARLVCSASEIRQAAAHLIGNALDAMPSGGLLTVRVRPATDWRGNSPGVRITVADTGCGISPEIRSRIYEPFFTTKDNLNTGLGLWVTAGIVERHGGSIHFRTKTPPGTSGSTFTVILPVAQ
jgi:PAS domain S-box-containing protein